MRARVLIPLALLALALPATAGAAPSIRVEGNHFVEGAGTEVQLVGVNRSSFEYTCVEPNYSAERNSGIYAGPISNRAVAAFNRWHLDVVRVPLNEQCWLGVNPVRRTEDNVIRLHGAAAAEAGRKLKRRYRATVKAFVKRLNQHGLIVILDLHWTAPKNFLADAQRPAPDASHAIAFWRTVAQTFRSNHSVIFDLFNEPINVGWKCLRDGGCRLKSNCADCETHNQPAPLYRVVGMQKLVNVIRATGAKQPLMIPGLYYSHDLRRWLQFKPRDPLARTARGSQIVASFHNYAANAAGINDPLCGRQCWENVIAPIARRVPVVTGEFGQFDCRSSYVRQYMNWADDHGISYLAWWWYVKSPFDGPGCQLDLIKNYLTGAPSPYGSAFRSHFFAVNP